jgi:hypothetical protein
VTPRGLFNDWGPVGETVFFEKMSERHEAGIQRRLAKKQGCQMMEYFETKNPNLGKLRESLG